MKEKDRIWHLMARKLSGEATEEEIKELELLQQQHPEMTYSLQLLSDLWKTQTEKEETETEDAFSRHLTRMTLKDLGQPVRDSIAPEPTQPRQSLVSRIIHHVDLLDNYFKIAWRRNFGKRRPLELRRSGVPCSDSFVAFAPLRHLVRALRVRSGTPE